MKALDNFKIELPSWGFANTGTRFGKFIQAAAATTIEEKFSDAAQVTCCHRRMPHAGAACSMGLAQWIAGRIRSRKIGKEIRDSPRIDQSQCFSESGIQVWLAWKSRPGNSPKSDSSYPGLCRHRGSAGLPRRCPVVCGRLQLSRARKTFENELAILRKACRKFTAALKPGQRLLIEYKPFEPAFLSHRRRRLGHGFSACQRMPGRKRSSWSTPGITIRPRTSNKSWPGCCTRK